MVFRALCVWDEEPRGDGDRQAVGAAQCGEGTSVPCRAHASSDSTTRAYTGAMRGPARPSPSWR